MMRHESFTLTDPEKVKEVRKKIAKSMGIPEEEVATMINEVEADVRGLYERIGPIIKLFILKKINAGKPVNQTFNIISTIAVNMVFNELIAINECLLDSKDPDDPDRKKFHKLAMELATIFGQMATKMPEELEKQLK